MNAIDLILVTWPNHPKRVAYFRRTVAALKRNLSATRHAVRWLCSAESLPDPSHPWQGDDLEAVCRAESIVLSWRHEPPSLGGAMNTALRLAAADLIFLVQDDWELLEPVDLSDGADLLTEHRDVDLVRYSFPAHMTSLVGELHGWPLVDLRAPWPYGDDPALRRRDFTQKFGWYLEGGRHGGSESDMVRRLVKGGARIVATPRPLFGHFGEVASVPAVDEHRPRKVSR